MVQSSAMAHTPPVDATRWHPLATHLHATATSAEVFGTAIGIPTLARLAGLLHDVGKGAPAFQAYLHACARAVQQGTPPPRKGVDHKTAGAVMAAAACPPVAFAILGHHGGLPSLTMLQQRLEHTAADPAVRQVIAEATSLQEDFTGLLAGASQEMARYATSSLDADLLIRLLYACLVDADALDTEAHFEPQTTTQRGQTVALNELWTVLEAAQEQIQAHATPSVVNAVRRAVYADCLQAAALPPGVFTLTVPTGGGKTRSSLAFALAHALRHGLHRVIYAVPYTSIIEQTAAVFRDIFPQPHAVLEHHSAVPGPAEDTDAGSNDSALWQRLAAENWDAPVIVTTTVQCFESLFAARPSACRKVHRLARSVLILDEVQTLPPLLLTPILDALRMLVERFGTTVVLCTATQPALTTESGLLRGFSQVREIVTDPARHFQALRRVTYRIETTPWSWERVADEMRTRDQCLTVVNTRKDALALLEVLHDEDALHLSTLLCPAHRRAVLADMRRRLRDGQPCRVVSTQVVEAGVDVDFPCVLRAVGPLDRLVQAAGRCNREGVRPFGEVIIFTPDTLRMPTGVYRTAFHHAAMLLRDPALDLHDPAIFPAYFRAVFGDVETDASGIQSLRTRLDFPGVAAAFRMIPDDTVPVLVPYDADIVEALVARVRAKGHLNRADWREAQQYSVALRRRDAETYRRQGMLVEVLPESGLYRWLGRYGARGVAEVVWDAADLIV